MAASVGGGGARSAVAHAEAALQVAQKSAQAAATEAASAHAAAVATRERLDTERVEIEGEQLALQDMLAHLAHVVAESREQRGREILDVATKHAVVLAQVVAGHERELVAARAQLAEHQQQTARDLQAYPVVAERMRGTIVEVPRQPAELETLLGTYLSFLDAVEHAQGHLDGLEVGGLWQVLSAPDPHVIIGALQGYNTWVQGKRHQARTFLESYRERLQLTQQQ